MFAGAKQPERRDHISHWPTDKANHEGMSSEKVPTVLHYLDDGMLWGSQIKANIRFNERVEWFKLFVRPTLSKMFGY